MGSRTAANSGTSAQPIITWWYTVLVIAIFAIGSVASAYQHGLPNAYLPKLSHRMSSYLTVLVEEWLGVFLVWLAIRSHGLTIGNLVSGRWETPRSFFKDLGLSLGFMVVAVPLSSALAYLLGASHNPALTNIAPQTPLELIVSLVLSAAAGFGEELVFRGYLMGQFSARTSSRTLGLLLQGIVFGLAHGYYGTAMAAIMVQGWMLGLFSYWRKSLRPAMLAHCLQDSMANLVAFFS